jgi:O-succinylbenzoic acid--CoA ligase
MSTFSVLDAARELPQATALVIGQREVTFGELGERVRARLPELAPLAASAARAAAPLVAFRASESTTTLELIYALLELGLPFLPLHARLTPEECETLLVRLPVQCLLEPRDQGPILLRARSPRPLAERERSWFQSTPQLVALATSGSSGTPHVVLLSRRAFLAAAAASAGNLGWLPDDRWLLCLPLAHVGGLSVVTRCLLARHPVVLADPDSSAESLDQRLARAILVGRPRLLSLVPTQLSALLQLGPKFELPTYVRVILTGGAAASASLLAACAKRRWPVLTSYGMTETCSQIATQRPGALHGAESGVGCALPGVELRISAGAIQVRGPTLFSGYLVGPPEPFDADGWFSTGDLGSWDANGQLRVLGRSDQVIISGGENVAPAEVEAALEACPGVLEACVFSVPDAHWGQLVAAALRLVPGDGALLLDGVRSELERKLAAFKRPRRYALTHAFVYGPTGKLDRRATASALAAQLLPVLPSPAPTR